MRVLAVLLLLALSGCAPVQRETITVFAAASLSGSFDEIAEAFEAENPGSDVVFNFGGSSALSTQIAQGASADVFASASQRLLSGQFFATNRLEIAVAAGAEITGLDDFGDPSKLIALCAVEVPCGSAAEALLRENGVSPSVDTYEQDVKAVLTKVELGEVDAGLVYVTDVIESGVDSIPVDSAPVAYPIKAYTEKGAAFVDFVLSPAGQAILTKAGFGAP
jgi:molybdate transport system substrate-binding protein